MKSPSNNRDHPDLSIIQEIQAGLLTPVLYEQNRTGNVVSLTLQSAGINQFPQQITQLSNLSVLDLENNRITKLPVQIARLTNLFRFHLAYNNLSDLPPEIAQLKNLELLDLSGNNLTELPPEIASLTNLRKLDLSHNRNLISPPPEIVARGTRAILDYLRGLQGGAQMRYEAKLILVGEGGTGKSSLLRSLRGEEFDLHLPTTHGVEVDKLSIEHPQEKEVEMTLNTWDFGGQQIYHATHQFFLTRRSLYLVIWNARLGAEQGRLTYWLETIKALAPDSPVLLVATHIDERAPDVNYTLLNETYSQLVGNLYVSNKDGKGIGQLKAALKEHATNLPLMGQPWPRTWADAEKALLARPEHHLNVDEYARTCASENVEEEIARTEFGNFLHDLGKILYFQNDDVLANLVVLKPNWVIKAISRVLTDSPTIEARGVLSHADLPRIWAREDDGVRYNRHLYPTFLRLMERFYLSYQIDPDIPGDHTTRSLVPQLLPHQPPKDLPAIPEPPPNGPMRVEMIFRLSFVPAGIMPWFIVRTHPYTTVLHWREGVMLKYEGHQARVELNPMRREIRLLVWGPQPHNFFTILKNTMDLILDRFEGLEIVRDVPCICHWQASGEPPCPRFYPYEDLIRRMNAKRYEVECQETYRSVSVRTLLYGIHESTQEQVLEEVRRNSELLNSVRQSQHEQLLLLAKNAQSLEWLVAGFARHWNYLMADIEAECPNTFFLMPGFGGMWNPRNWVSEEYNLFLVCQHPPHPHGVGDGYSVRQPEKWWKAVAPWLNHAIQFLQFAVPLGTSFNALRDPEIAKKMKEGMDFMQEVVKAIPLLPEIEGMEGFGEPTLATERYTYGSVFRALQSFLKEADKANNWGGLRKTVTPDGNILWLCPEHYEPYQAKPLKLND